MFGPKRLRLHDFLRVKFTIIAWRFWLFIITIDNSCCRRSDTFKLSLSLVDVFCACDSSYCNCGCPMHIQFNEIRSKNRGNQSYAKDQTNLFSFSSQSHCQKSNWFLISVCPQSNIWPKKKRLFFSSIAATMISIYTWVAQDEIEKRKIRGA